MENEYVLRLQDYEGYSNCFVECFGVAFDRVLCVRHMGKKRDNPHYHFCLRTTYDKRDSLARHLKKFFTKGKGNKHMSLKKWDGKTEALSYMFHEDSGPVFVKGYQDSDIELFKNLDKEIRAKHVKPGDVCQLILDQILKAHDGASLMQREPFKTQKFIFRYLYYHFLRNSDWMPNRFQFERYINRVRMLYVNSVHDIYPQKANDYCDQLYSEYFGR